MYFAVVILVSPPVWGEYTFEAPGGLMTAVRLDVYWDSSGIRHDPGWLIKGNSIRKTVTLVVYLGLLKRTDNIVSLRIASFVLFIYLFIYLSVFYICSRCGSRTDGQSGEKGRGTSRPSCAKMVSARSSMDLCSPTTTCTQAIRTTTGRQRGSRRLLCRPKASHFLIP